jgi:hypothetical protein
MNSQDFDYLSREIESIRRELGAGIPVPEKKSAVAGASNEIPFASLKVFPGASSSGFSSKYIDGDMGYPILPFLCCAIPGVPTSSADYESRLFFDSASSQYLSPVSANTFCYDQTDTGNTIIAYFISGGQQSPYEYGTPPYPYYLSNGITLTKVTSSRTSTTPVYRSLKVIETRPWTLSNGSTGAVMASVENSSESHAIVGVSPDTFVVAGDKSSFYPVGANIVVYGSTGNDGNYVVESSSYDSGSSETTVFTTTSIPSLISDGTISFSSGVLISSPQSVFGLFWPGIGVENFEDAVCTYSKSASKFIAYPNNFLKTYSGGYTTFIGFASPKNPQSGGAVVFATFSSETGYPFYLSTYPCLNPFSVNDRYIPKGYIALEQKSYQSNTILIRLRHGVTGELYEGEFSITSTAVYYNAAFHGSGGRIARKPAFALPPVSIYGNLTIYESTMTMGALPAS